LGLQLDQGGRSYIKKGWIGKKREIPKHSMGGGGGPRREFNARKGGREGGREGGVTLGVRVEKDLVKGLRDHGRRALDDSHGHPGLAPARHLGRREDGREGGVTEGTSRA